MDCATRKQEAAVRLAEAETLARSGAYKRAIEALEQVLGLDPELADAYFWRGFCHYMSGHYRHAARDMDAATLLGCHTAQMWSRHETGPVDDEPEPCPENPQ
jgi:tetratricopeptide (TPR) repeat protein